MLIAILYLSDTGIEIAIMSYLKNILNKILQNAL